MKNTFDTSEILARMEFEEYFENQQVQGKIAETTEEDFKRQVKKIENRIAFIADTGEKGV